MTDSSPVRTYPTIEARLHGGNLKSWVVLPSELTVYAATPAAMLLLTDLAQALVKQCASAAAPRGHRGGLVSEVAVPGRTAHEGKPASHDTSVPSPPHPPEGAGTLGRYPCGARSTINGAHIGGDGQSRSRLSSAP